MSGFFSNFLKESGDAFFGNDYLRDFQHASKTFRTNAYGYAPKFKFLFHVYFDINTSLIPATMSWPQDKNFGLAVKNIQLPKYTFDVTTLNQYNRKRVVQTKIKYDPVQIVFHDDNQNLIRKLWHTYYTYYYKDAAQPDSEATLMSGRNIYQNELTTNQDWGYIGEGTTDIGTAGTGLGASKPQFFKSIDIYGFNQHNFALYRLINPIIESFGHDTYDYSQGNGVMENTMSVQYETVKYYEGALDGRNPGQLVKEFGSVDHYDRTLSPISRPGSNSSILGQGGLLDSTNQILNDLANGNYIGAMQAAGRTANTFKNANWTKIAQQDIFNVARDSVNGTPNRNNAFNFPAAASSATSTVNSAVQRVIGTVK